MTIKNVFIKFPLITLTIIVVLLSCKEQTLNMENKAGDGLKGTLAGKISIGPLCPVETVPPSPGCQPTEETYKAWAVAIWTKDRTTKIGVISPHLDGSYQIDVQAGDYIIDFDSRKSNGIGGSNLPFSISIEAQKTSKFDIVIDTGIR